MELSFKPLWKLLIDLDITQKELREKANLSSSTCYKLKNNQNVTTDVLLRVCGALQCDFSKIMTCVEVKHGEN